MPNLFSGEKIFDVFRKSGIDTFVFDIQDVGARFYTFVWLMYDCMLAAAKLGIKVVVLDRPNPVGGNTNNHNNHAHAGQLNSFTHLRALLPDLKRSGLPENLYDGCPQLW